MPPISSPGIGSGLDIATIVQTLVSAETTPARNRITLKQSNYTSELSFVGQIKGVLSKLQTTVAKLSKIDQFYGLGTTVSDTSILSATTTSSAQAGAYQVEVLGLAKSQSLASTAFANTTTAIGSGTIKIDFGTYSQDLSTFTANSAQSSVTVNIGSGQGTLEAIKNAINEKNAGVTAAIVQDNQGARLTLTSKQTGVAYAMKITVTDDDTNSTDASGLSALAYDPTTAVNNLTQTVTATDSSIKVNGLTLTQSSNIYESAISGVSLKLTKEAPGTLVNLTVSQDQSIATKAIDEFIKSYNESMALITGLTGFNTETKQSGVFQGDPAIRNLKFNLTQLVSEPLATKNSTLKSLKDIGISSSANGQLVLDKSKLNAALAEHYEEVGALFAKNVTATDSNVKVSSFGKNVPAGSYTLNINSYTPNVSLTGTLGNIAFHSSDGKNLTGTGIFSSVELQVLGGSTGYRGKLEVTDGAAVTIDNLLSTYLNSGGIIQDKTDTLNSKLKALDNQTLKLNDRAASLNRRYTAQYARLDALLGSLQGLSQSLSQSLANLPKPNSIRNN